MCKHSAAALVIIFLCIAVPKDVVAVQGRNTLKITRTLYRTSKFLFWTTTKKIDLLLEIIDQDKNGYYDSYNWLEDGALLNTGSFETDMNDRLFEKKLKDESKKSDTVYLTAGSDEYFIKVYSKYNKTILGEFICDVNFSNPLMFEYYKYDFRSKIVINLSPKRDTSRNRIDYYFTVNLNKPSRRGRFFENHHIIITDANFLNQLEYNYIIDGDLINYGPIISSISVESLKAKFIEEVLQKNINVFERLQDRIRVSICSKRDSKSFAFFVIKLDGVYPMYYWEYSNFNIPFIPTSDKLEVSIFEKPYINNIPLYESKLGLVTLKDIFKTNALSRNLFYNMLTN